MSLVAHPMSQPNLDFSPIWTPITAEEVRKLRLRPVSVIWECALFMLAMWMCPTCATLIGIGLFTVRPSLVFKKFYLLEF
jgi:hypothetical protein